MRYANQLNFDFLQRLFFVGLSGSLIITVVFTFLMSTLAALMSGPIFVLASMLVLSIVCVIIAVLGDVFLLSEFPLISVLQGDLDAKGTQRAKEQVRKVLFALPLSFSAAGIWLLLLMTYSNHVGFLLILFLLSPVTIMLVIIHTDCETPRQALNKSGRTLLFMGFILTVLVPPFDANSMDGLKDVHPDRVHSQDRPPAYLN
jgi:hypothetical protein